MRTIAEILRLHHIPKGEPFHGGDYEICERLPSGVPMFRYVSAYQVGIAEGLWSALEPEDLPRVLLRGDDHIERLRSSRPELYVLIRKAADLVLKGGET